MVEAKSWNGKSSGRAESAAMGGGGISTVELSHKSRLAAYQTRREVRIAVGATNELVDVEQFMAPIGRRFGASKWLIVISGRL